jgi:hypothetical protein
MTIDAGLKAEGAAERSPIAGAGTLGRRCRSEALFGPTQDGGGGAFVAGRTVGCRRPGSECLCGQADRMGEASARRRGVSPEGRERDDREDEIARLKSKLGEITMDSELLSAKIAAMEAKSPLARRRSRR